MYFFFQNCFGVFWLSLSVFFLISLILLPMHEDENAPCVGLCYHNKLQALEEKSDDYSRGWPLNRKEFDKQPPCTGLCQMFRELNLPNPFDGRFQHTGTRPTPKPTTQSTSRPS